MSNGVLLQLSDDDGNAIELPSQGVKEFPRFLDGGIATENTDPAAYRATHSYLFSFAGSDTVYTLTVAGSAHEVDLLRNTLANVFTRMMKSFPLRNRPKRSKNAGLRLLKSVLSMNRMA